MSSLQDRPNLASIRQKAETLAGAIVRTPFLAAPRLAALTGSDVRVKYENMQVTASFKERGALAKLVTLSEEERARGVIARSALATPSSAIRSIGRPISSSMAATYLPSSGKAMVNALPLRPARPVRPIRWM